MFKIDFEIIHQVGGARSLREVVAEAENLVFRYSSTWIRQLLRFRISGKRVISMGEILFEEERPPRKSPV